MRVRCLSECIRANAPHMECTSETPAKGRGFSFFAQRKHMRKERRMAEKIDFGELVLKGDVDAPAVRKPAKKAKADLGRLTASS